MNIRYVYTRKRADFGKQCNFSDRASEIHADIPANPEFAGKFILRNPVSRGIQHTGEMSEHEVNTERVLSEVRGINHTEGGWPKDVNYNEPEQVQRYRKKIEKDELYTVTLHALANSVEHCIKQNNALNIYEEYFNDIENDASEEPPSAKIVNVFRDINEIKRTAAYVSWFPEGPTKIAVAYSNIGFLENGADTSMDSYIWDFSNPNRPDLVLSPPSSLVCVEFNPKDTHSLVGGCHNGQLCLWDRRKGSLPVEVSPVENSHRDPAWQAIWIQSKTGTEFFSTSTDGQVLWWDVRKMNEPTEILYLDPTKNQDLNCSIGAYALEYEPTIPTKFMAGTEQGMIISCNRKGKSPAEKVAAVFPGHKGPVYALQRNPFFTKFFLSVGDWSARIWSEDMKDDPIMWTPYHESGATDGCWSSVRPALFFMTRLNGCLELWDYVFKQREPTLNIKISDESLHCVRVNEDGQLVAVGSHSGVTTILELSGGFTAAAKNEKATVGAMFERETHREKILEARAKELRVKERQRAIAEAAASGAPTASTQGSRPVEGSAENAEKEEKAEMADGETAGRVSSVTNQTKNSVVSK
ncbi:Dynein intermediate chain 3 ciliary [Taenia solium]|eukprot:TsM_000688400 transcript=TsM_000688400 gene=TsM_000688400